MRSVDAGIENCNHNVRYAGSHAPSLERLDLSQMPFVAGNDIRITGQRAGVSEIIALREFNIRIILQRSKNSLRLLGAYGENLDICASKSPAMESAVRVHTARKFGVRQVRLGLDKDPARHKP